VLVLRAACVAVAVVSIQACCFGGGEDRTVLAQAELACGPTTAHVRRVQVVTNRFEGVSVTTREVAFGEAAALEAVPGRLGAWRLHDELPEHVRSPRMTDADTLWILMTSSDVEYRCLTEHLLDIEAVFEPEHPLVIFHASDTDVVPTFTAHRGGASLTLQIRTDGSLFAQTEQGGSRDGTLIGQMVREPSGRVLAIARDALFGSGLPPEFADASAMLAVARDEQGRALLERFPAETRLVGMTEMLQLR
jgi:hypothetical protein